MGATTYTAHQYANAPAICREAFDLINSERASCGISPLSWNEGIAQEAREHSVYMATIDKLEHSDKNYAENIVMGATSSGAEMYEAWKASPKHRENYLDGSLSTGAIGIGFKTESVQLGGWTITYQISRGYATFLAR